MCVQWIRSWRLSSYSRRSLCPLSSLNGFALELLKELHICVHAAAVDSAVAKSGLFTGAGSSNTLGSLWRSLLVKCLVVSKRKHGLYRGYVK